MEGELVLRVEDIEQSNENMFVRAENAWQDTIYQAT